MSLLLQLSNKRLPACLGSSRGLFPRRGSTFGRSASVQLQGQRCRQDTSVTSSSCLCTTSQHRLVASEINDTGTVCSQSTVDTLRHSEHSVLRNLVSLKTTPSQTQTLSLPSVYATSDSVFSHHIEKLLKQLQKEIQSLSQLLVRPAYSDLRQKTQWKLVDDSIHHFSSSRSNAEQHQDKDQQQQQRENSQENDDDEKKPGDNIDSGLSMIIRVATYVVLGLFVVRSMQDQSPQASWNEFVHDMLLKGEVSHIIVNPETENAVIVLRQGAVIKNTQDPRPRRLKITDPAKFENKIRQTEAEFGIRPEDSVPIHFQRSSPWPFILLLGVICLFAIRAISRTKLPSASDIFNTKAKFVRVDLQQKGKGISFKDVAGLHEAKVEIMEFVDYLRTPEKYKKLGAKIPKGALLLGPPGCGKTLLAKAVASEAQVPFLAMAGSDFVEMVGGLGAARVRDLFKEARQKAPCIIYIDEVDAIGRKRTGPQQGGDEEGEHTLNQLLVEMDGIGTSGNVIVMGSTNRPDVLDNALLRAGRFDRHVTIDLPTLAERKEMFNMYLSKLKIRGTPENYSERLAQLSPGMSGADIANICNEAALHAARDKQKVVETANFDYAVERVSGGVAKKSRVLSPQEKKVVAYHEAGHALVGWMLEHTDVLLRVSIVPRTNAKLGLSQYMPSDKKLLSKEELFQKMCMMLGGRVAESLTFNSVTSGAEDDLKSVSKMAYLQIRQLGMNERIGLVSFPDPDGRGFSGEKPYSKRTAALIDEEARILVGNVYKQTEKVLKHHTEKLRLVAEALLEKEAMSYKDMEQLIGPPPFGGKKTVSAEWELVPEDIPAST